MRGQWAAGCLAVAAVLSSCKGGKSPEVQYTTVKADRGDVVAVVTAGGTLQALVTVQVGTQVSGRITELKADYNSMVRKGQVVARIDPQSYETAVQGARANVAAAEGSLAKARAAALNAELQARRAVELAPRGLIARQDVDTANATWEQAKADVLAAQGNLAQARAQLKSAEVNLGYTVITSPTDGTVITRSVDVGQTVAASLQAPTLFTIAQDLTKMQVHTSVAESDVGQLKEGGPAEFTVDAYPGVKFAGTVSQVRVSPTTVQNVVTYDAVVDVSNPDLKLKPGMTANVTFRTAEAKNALRIPNAVLRFKPAPEVIKAIFEKRRAEREARGEKPDEHRQRDSTVAANAASGGETAPPPPGMPGAGVPGGSGPRGDHPLPPGVKRVWLKDGDSLKPVRIRVGVSDGSYTAVEDGELKEGDELVTAMQGGDSKKTSSPFAASGAGGPAGGGPRGPM